MLHFVVEWCPALQPIHSLKHGKELVDEFEARPLALRKDREEGMGPSVKHGRKMMVGGDVLGD